MIDEKVKYIIYFLIFRLTFQFSPSSKVYGFSEVDLVRNGGDQVCVEKTGDEIKNVGLFSPLHPNFTLHILHTVLYLSNVWSVHSVSCAANMMLNENVGSFNQGETS